MSSNNTNRKQQSKEDEILSRQRSIAMVRAAAKSKPPPPPSNSDKIASTTPSRTLSSLTGLPAKGSLNNPILLDDKQNASSSQQAPKQSLKRPRPKLKPEAVLAQARQRIGSVDAMDDTKPPKEPQLKRPSMKRPALRNHSLPASATSTTTTKHSATAASTKGALSSLLLSNQSTAKYLAPDAPKLLKHYPKVEPDDYWKILREWDFLKELNERMAEGRQKRKRADGNDNDSSSNNGNNQKDSQKDNNTKKEQTIKTPKPLPDKFTSHREYISLWSPLIMTEARAQLLSDAISDIPYLNSRPDRHPIRVKVEVRKKDLEGDSDAIGLMVVEVLDKGDKCNLMAGDLVCFTDEKTFWSATKGTLGDSKPPSSTNTTAAASATARNEQPNCIVGHLEHTRRTLTGLTVTISRTKWKQIGQEIMALVKIGSNVTSLREFTALCRMDRLPLADYILCGKMNLADDAEEDGIKKADGNGKADTAMKAGDSSKEKRAKEEILRKMGGSHKLGQGFVKYASNKFNLSQLRGISASAAEYGDGGFTLIKGPPGTGKTTTLCALLNALHIRQMNQYYEEVRKLAQSHDAVVGKRADLSLAEAKKKRPRILVCAPSNAAVDNIILKILEDKFVDGKEGRYTPTMVRIGSGQSPAVKEVCLDDKVEVYLGKVKDENISTNENELAIEGLRGEQRRIMADISKARQRMTALKYAAPYELCKDWEIRIDEKEDGQFLVFFTNHKEPREEHKHTRQVPPPPEPGDKTYPATAMPTYRRLLSEVVRFVERYNNIGTEIEGHTLVQSAKAALSGGGHSRAMNDIRLQVETHILDSVHIVMTTLGTAGNRALEAANKFEVVVIDEAAQSVEPSTLAGLQLGSSHAILVGDPQQLPATIFSMSGRNTKYDRSLFARLEEAGHAVHMLDTQYRMHPAISDFPRRIFYDGKLIDGKNVMHPEYGNPLKRAVFRTFKAFQPFTVLDLESSEERGGTSLANSAEAQLALHLFNSLKSGTGGLSTKSRVAVITPYSQQAALLRRTFSNHLKEEYEKLVEINTVDAFQGREANIVIFSCVRAAGSKGIGFLSDVRRMNVALTRAKHFLFVIARCSSIVVNPYWRDLVNHARETDAVIKVPFSGSRQSAFNFPDLSSLKAASKTEGNNHRKESSREKEDGTKSGKEKRNVVELMGLTLEIPPTKPSGR